MPSQYIQPDDYATYGLPDTTTVAQVLQASAIIDGYLNKPDGLVYLEIPTGNPVVMAATNQPISESKTLNLRGQLWLSYQPVVKVLSLNYNESYPGSLPRYLNANLTTNVSYLPDGQLWLSDAPSKALANIQYIAGWTYDNLPNAIKVACATIVSLNAGFDLTNGLIADTTPLTSYRAGDTEIDFAKPVSELSMMLYSNIAMLSVLAPYKRVFA